VIGSLSFSAAGMALLALAPGYAWMCAAAAVGGVPQGWSNPATNGLLSARVSPGRRGTLTGVKQSGVTLGIFLAGATLPALEHIWGWRGAAWTFAAVFAAAAALVRVCLDPDPTIAAGPGAVDGPRAPLAGFVWMLTGYAFFMGLAAGSVGRFLPLFAEEALGFSTAIAGLIAALGGLLGMAARIVAARTAEHRVAPTRLLVGLSLVGAGYCLLLGLLTPATRGLLWLSPILNAVGTNAWNAVAMLAVIMYVATSDAGRASGVVMFGFLGGLAVAGPVAGALIDGTDSYRPVWFGAMATSLVAAAIVLADRRRRADAMMG
jgi:predicted MFS family arabinose efflux permease